VAVDHHWQHLFGVFGKQFYLRLVFPSILFMGHSSKRIPETSI
jgi:hypothetical protein